MAEPGVERLNQKSWAQISELFYSALELPLTQRTSFLESNCLDLEIRSEVEQLLTKQAQQFGQLDDPKALLRSTQLGLGSRLGQYAIYGVLGAGGMGTVYEAIQDKPRRHVALKTLHFGYASPKQIDRFRFEFEVLGRLRHPAIAQVYEAGTLEVGCAFYPYFAMELVAGARDIVDYANELTTSLTERLELFCKVCAAVHYGHQKGVLHRQWR